MGSSTSRFLLECGLSESLRISFTHKTSGATATREVKEPYILFGRHLQNTVLLDDPSVSKKHAYLQIVEGCAFVVDLGSRTGVRINGGVVSQSWLDPDQTLEIGEFDIRISGPLKNPAERSSPTHLIDGTDALRIALVSGNDSEGLIHCPLRCVLTLIGRDPTCNFRLIDSRLRNFHAVVVQTRSDAWLVDLLGSGVTRINDRAVRSSPLQIGDRIELNGVTLEVQIIRSEPNRNATGSALQSNSNPIAHYTPVGDDTQPLVEQVGDLRQATLLMASLFAEMKREQTQLMQRQIQLMEVMTDAFRGFRNAESTSPIIALAEPASPVATTLDIPIQTPRMANPADEEALAQAHEWFLGRLKAMGKSPSG